jgi:hypothetical protein
MGQRCLPSWSTHSSPSSSISSLASTLICSEGGSKDEKSTDHVRNIQVGIGLSKGVGKNEAEGLMNVLLCKKVLLRSPVVGKVDDQLEESTRLKLECTLINT